MSDGQAERTLKHLLMKIIQTLIMSHRSIPMSVEGQRSAPFLSKFFIIECAIENFAVMARRKNSMPKI